MIPIFWFFIGALVFWCAEWIFDIYLWRKTQSNNAPLLARASSAESQSLSLRSDLDLHKLKVNSFEKHVSDLDVRLGAANGLVKDKSSELEALSIEMAKLNQKMATMVDKRTFDAATAEVNSLKTQLTTANHAVDAMKPTADKVATLEAQISGFKAQYEGAVPKTDLENANAEIISLKTRVQTYSEQTEAFIMARKRIEFLETENTELKSKPDGVAVAVHEGVKAKTLALETEVNQLKSDGVLLMKDRLAPALERIAFLESEQSKTPEVSDSADLKIKLASLEAEHADLHAKVSGVADLEAKMTALEAEKTDLHAKISSLEAGAGSGADLPNRFASLELEKTNLISRISTLESSVATVDTSALDKKIANLESEKADLMAKLATPTPATDSSLDTRVAALEADLVNAKNVGNHAVADLAALKLQLSNAHQEISGLKAFALPIGDQNTEVARLRLEIEQLTHAPKAPIERDRLEKIDGIGDVYEHRLNAAGIWSFTQLSQMSVDSILNLIQPEEWQKIEPDKWILEASERAKAKVVS